MIAIKITFDTTPVEEALEYYEGEISEGEAARRTKRAVVSTASDDPVLNAVIGHEHNTAPVETWMETVSEASSAIAHFIEIAATYYTLKAGKPANRVVEESGYKLKIEYQIETFQTATARGVATLIDAPDGDTSFFQPMTAYWKQSWAEIDAWVTAQVLPAFQEMIKVRHGLLATKPADYNVEL